MKKKLLVFAAVMVMLIAALCASAFAAEVVDSGECGENVMWAIDSDGVLTISGDGEMDSHPWWDYDEMLNPVYNLKIKSVVISNGVTTISYEAFHYCTSLTSVTIPNSVTKIKDCAFECCTSLKSVSIPDSVAEIGYRVFEDCTSLVGIHVGVNNPNYSSDDKGVLFNKHKTTLIQAPGAITEYTIPDSVTKIGEDAFSNCVSLTSVTIGNRVTAISWNAFYDCSSLASVTIGNKVNKISNYAFDGCSSLINVTIPDSVTTIGDSAFHSCTSLTSVTIPASVTSIGDTVFGNCTSLTGIHVDVGNPNYSSDDKGILFNKDKSTLIQAPGAIKVYTIPDSVTTIDNYAFSRCTLLTNVTIPYSVTKIGDSVFRSCTSLTSIHVDDGNPNYCNDDKGVLFSKDMSMLIQAPGAITEYSIPASVTTIYDSAFHGCSSLKNITIGINVTRINRYAFYNCTSLTDVYYSGNEEQWQEILIYSNYSNEPLLNAKIHYNSTGSITHPQGDIDGNGKVENSDLVTVARYIVGLTEGDTKAAVEAYADMNGDGKVDNADIVTVARKIVGLA